MRRRGTSRRSVRAARRSRRSSGDTPSAPAGLSGACDGACRDGHARRTARSRHDLGIVEAIVSGPGEGEPLREEERTILVKAVQPQLDVLEFTITDAGYEGPGPHYHERHVDSFYVLEGELEFPAVGATVVAGPGTYVFAPPGTVHAFTNRTPPGVEHGVAPSTGPVRLLNVHAPDAGFAGSLRR